MVFFSGPGTFDCLWDDYGVQLALDVDALQTLGGKRGKRSSKLSHLTTPGTDNQKIKHRPNEVNLFFLTGFTWTNCSGPSAPPPPTSSLFFVPPPSLPPLAAVQPAATVLATAASPPLSTAAALVRAAATLPPSAAAPQFVAVATPRLLLILLLK